MWVSWSSFYALFIFYPTVHRFSQGELFLFCPLAKLSLMFGFTANQKSSSAFGIKAIIWKLLQILGPFCATAVFFGAQQPTMSALRGLYWNEDIEVWLCEIHSQIQNKSLKAAWNWAAHSIPAPPSQYQTNQQQALSFTKVVPEISFQADTLFHSAVLLIEGTWDFGDSSSIQAVTLFLFAQLIKNVTPWNINKDTTVNNSWSWKFIEI